MTCHCFLRPIRRDLTSSSYTTGTIFFTRATLKYMDKNLHITKPRYSEIFCLSLGTSWYRGSTVEGAMIGEGAYKRKFTVLVCYQIIIPTVFPCCSARSSGNVGKTLCLFSHWMTDYPSSVRDNPSSKSANLRDRQLSINLGGLFIQNQNRSVFKLRRIIWIPSSRPLICLTRIIQRIIRL